MPYKDAVVDVHLSGKVQQEYLRFLQQCGEQQYHLGCKGQTPQLPMLVQLAQLLQ
tara:strand:+ start:2140 stop:2304 length:165 start_codon:yes stop_codon:yes gene_type:complete